MAAPKARAGARAKSGPDAARPVGPGAAARSRTSPAKASPAKASPAKSNSARTSPAQGAANQRPAAARARGGRVGPDPADLEVVGPPAWLRWSTFALALIGLGVSVYLTYAHYTESTLAGCTETTGVVNCGKVTTSAQSMVFGIPVAVLGLAFYVFMVAIMSPWAWRSSRREVGLARILSLVVGIGFVLYLLYAELFDIGSICLYCTSIHVITFVLFVLTGLAVAIWGLSTRTVPRQSLR